MSGANLELAHLASAGCDCQKKGVTLRNVFDGPAFSKYPQFPEFSVGANCADGCFTGKWRY
jgi:hypothetical protein